MLGWPSGFAPSTKRKSSKSRRSVARSTSRVTSPIITITFEKRSGAHLESKDFYGPAVINVTYLQTDLRNESAGIGKNRKPQAHPNSIVRHATHEVRELGSGL